MTSEISMESLATQIPNLVVASAKPIESLTNYILDTKITRKNWKKEEFLPENSVRDLTQEPIVKAALEAAKIAPAEVVKELVDFVCGKDLERSGRRLFLILVMMSEDREQLSLLKRLKDCGVDDSALPIGFYSEDPFKGQGFSLENPRGGKPGPESRRFPVFAEMTRSNRTLFNWEQWRFLAPVFSPDHFRFFFNKDRRLPYLKVSLEPVSNGYFGEVWQAEVLAAHAPESLRVSAFLSSTLTKCRHCERQKFDDWGGMF